MSTGLTNWAGNLEFAAQRVHRPRSVDELRRVVAGARQVRALGTGHSFNAIADTAGDLVSVAGLPQEAVVDRERSTVTVSAGMRYGELAVLLDAQGLALHNLGSLAHISVAGACQTATHGSGTGNGSLATAVAAVELVTADGTVAVVDRSAGDEFDGAVVGLGALGVVTRVTLEVVPAYRVRQDVYLDLPWEVLDGHFEEIASAAYSVSIFTDWRSPAVSQVWLKRHLDRDGDWAPPREWFGASRAAVQLHPLLGLPAVNCTEQLGAAGPWYERLPHFRLDFTPSNGKELQSEYFVPRAHAPGAVAALGRIRERIAPLLQVCEIRTVAADRHWLSPAYGRDSAAFHFTWLPDSAGVAPVLEAIEEQLAPFDPRPHWAKLFRLGPETVRGAYPRAADFAALAAGYDPEGVFRNELLDRYLPG